MTQKYEVTLERFHQLQDLVAKLNKRAAKFKLPPLDLRVLREFHKQGRITSVEQGNQGKYEKTRAAIIPMVEFTLEGENPILAGWRVLATLEHVEGGTLTFPTSDDLKLPEKYKTAKPDCDHCQKKRDRNTTFVLQNADTKKVLQVGSSCLVDFIGQEDALGWAQHAHDVGAFLYELGRGDLDDEPGERTGHVRAWDLIGVLEIAAAVIRKTGAYVSKAEEEESLGRRSATVNDVYLYLTDPKVKIVVTAADVQQAALVKAFVDQLAEKPPEDRSSYEHNIVVATRPTYVTRKTLGLAVSAYAALARQERQAAHDAADARRAARGEGQHVGKVGERTVFPGLTLLRVIAIDGHYGTTYIHHFEDPAGNMLVWFGSQPLPERWPTFEENQTGVKPPPARPGQVVDVKATVKKHEWYSRKLRQGFTSKPTDVPDAVPQTSISRVELHVEKPKTAKKSKKANPVIYEDARGT